MNEDLQTDEEALDAPKRDNLLASAILQRKGRPLGELIVRKITAETLSYLFEINNFFIRGLKGDREKVSPANANAIWSTAEFIYLHAGDPDEVADVVWLPTLFRQKVRETLAGPLNDPLILNAALPLIETMVGEYFAAQTEVAATPGRTKLARPGKAQARHGKRPI